MRRAALVVLAVLLFGLGLLAASCGGGGGGKSADTDTVATTAETETGETETTETETTETETTDTGSATDTIVGESDAYKTGQAICGNLPLDLLAQQYGVKADAKTVARAVAAGVGSPSSQEYKDAYAGCLAAIRGGQ